MAFSLAATQIKHRCPAGELSVGLNQNRITQSLGDFDTCLFLLADANGQRVCLVTSGFDLTSREVSKTVRQSLGRGLALPTERILLFSSHCHTIPRLATRETYLWNAGDHPEDLPAQWTEFGAKFFRDLCRAADSLRDQLKPCTISIGRSAEQGVSYNRRGRTPEGNAYLIREEDRLKLPVDYIGLIDPDASLVVFESEDGKAMAALTHFTAHPVTAYHPERMIAHPDWPQTATRHLAEMLGNPSLPVGFLQGCAGDINSKFMLSGDLNRSSELGRLLGQAFVRAHENRQPASVDRIICDTATITLPYRPLPGRAELQRDLKEMDDFMQRCRDGDESTLRCVGMNFPRALSPAYRAQLVEAIRPWYVWALGRPSIPTGLQVPCVMLRLGPILLTGMAFEPFVSIGLNLKANLPGFFVLPCGYCNEAHGYIPDAAGCDDTDYMGGFHRYTRYRPGFMPPAGSAIASEVAAHIRRIFPSEKSMTKATS